MTAIRFADALRYGGKALSFLVGILVVGGGTIALGILVARNEVAGPWFDPAITTSPELAAGILLVLVGGIVLVSGLIALWFKVLTDAIAYGFGAEVRQFDFEPTVTVELEEAEIATASVDETAQTRRQEPKSSHVGQAERMETATAPDSATTQKSAPSNAPAPTNVEDDADGESEPPVVQESTPVEESPVGHGRETGSNSVSRSGTGSPDTSETDPDPDTTASDRPVDSEEWEGEWSDVKGEESRVKRANDPERTSPPSAERAEKTAAEIAFGSNTRVSQPEQVSDEPEKAPREGESASVAEDSSDPLAASTAPPEHEGENSDPAEEEADESEPEEDSNDVESGTESEKRDPLDDMLGDKES